MHSIQSSKGRHNIFSETDHDRKLVDTVSQKTKSSKRVAFADTGVVLPPISSPTSSTVLPDIDLNVRKKLASNDLHVKFSHKSNVLTVASTLSKKEKSGKDGNEDTPGMDIEGGNHDDLDRISVKSNYSENLEQLKLEMTLASSMSGYTPLTSPSRSIVGPFSPVTLENGDNHLEDMLDEHFQKIDEYDDDDHGRFGTEIEEHQYSRTDPKLYKSTLHAHEQFMSKSKLKNNMKYIKTVGSTKTLPANEMIEGTKKARSVLESASFSPTKSSKHESIKSPMTPPPKSPSQLKPLTTSFMFLSALTIGKVPKLAREEKQLKEMQQQVISNNNENKLGVNTYTTDDIAYGMDENKALSPMFSPERGDDKHFRAPLERTNSPVMKPNLSTKTFTRFGASNMSATTVLRSIKSLDGRTSPSSLPMEEEKKNEVKKEPTEAGDDNEEEEGTIEKLKKLVAGPTYEASTHLYDIPTLTALTEDKRAVLKGMDNVVNNLTYVKAPEKPKAPAPKSPEPLTLQSVLGEHLMEHKPDEPLPVTDDEFNQLVFGNKDFTIEGHTKLKKFQELQKDKTNPYLKKQQQSNKSHNTNNFINSPTPSITSIPKQEENVIVESSDAPLQPSSQKSSKSKKLLRSSSDNNYDPVTGESMRSLDSNYSSATFVPYNPDEPTYVPHNDPRLPPLDFAALHNPQTNNWSSAASVNSNMGSVAMDPPPRRRSFLNLAANPYGMMRQSFLRNFNKRNGMSTDSSDQVIARSGSGAASTVHDYTKALSQTTQHFLSAIAKQFSRSHDIMSGPAGGGSVSVQNNDPFILPSDDFYQPKYYILNEGKDFGDDESFASPKTNKDNYHHFDEEQKKKVRGKQDYKLEKIEQPLSNPKQEFVYQYSTNSYVPKDYINHSAYGFYQRGGGLNEGMDSPYPDNSNYNEKEEYRKRKEEYFSERHLERIEDTTTGKCEPVIYLPPNFSQPEQHQSSSLPSEHYEGEEGGEDSYGGGENASLHSHNILKVYSRNASHQKMLTPGLVIAETAYHKVTDLIENPDPKQPHYIHHQPKHPHVTFNDEPEEKNKGETEDEEDEEDVLPSQTPMKASPPLAIMTSPQSDYHGSSKKNLFPTSSNLDLRDEIAQFRHKTNSPLRHEYEQHVEKTMAKPTSLNPHFGSSMSTVSIDNQSLASFASPGVELSHSRRPSDSRRSISSDISVNKDDAHQKLWEKLHSRYSGDREGEYQTKLKVAQYLKDGVKEETQIMKKYLEEIEEW